MQISCDGGILILNKIIAFVKKKDKPSAAHGKIILVIENITSYVGAVGRVITSPRAVKYSYGISVK